MRPTVVCCCKAFEHSLSEIAFIPILQLSTYLQSWLEGLLSRIAHYRVCLLPCTYELYWLLWC